MKPLFLVTPECMFSAVTFSCSVREKLVTMVTPADIFMTILKFMPSGLPEHLLPPPCCSVALLTAFLVLSEVDG